MSHIRAGNRLVKSLVLHQTASLVNPVRCKAIAVLVSVGVSSLKSRKHFFFNNNVFYILKKDILNVQCCLELGFAALFFSLLFLHCK